MLIFFGIFISGFFVVATYINQENIVRDANDALGFFETQLNTYAKNPAIVCNLAFGLQSIKDYHLPLEFDGFKKMDEHTMLIVRYNYDTTIRTRAVRRLTDPGSCNVMPVDPQPNGDSSNAVSDGGHIDGNAELALAEAIKRWLDTDYFRSDDATPFRTYQTTKAFIFLHALSLGSRVEDARIKLRDSAVDMITKLNSERFAVCQMIMHSLFLRRQNAILIRDDQGNAVGTLMGLLPEELWPRAGVLSKAEPAMHLTDIMQPQNYTGPFWLPAAARLYEPVFKNVQIYIQEAASYVRLLKARGIRNEIGPSRARAIRTFIKILWEKLEGRLVADLTTTGQTADFVKAEHWE